MYLHFCTVINVFLIKKVLTKSFRLYLIKLAERTERSCIVMEHGTGSSFFYLAENIKQEISMLLNDVRLHQL